MDNSVVLARHRLLGAAVAVVALALGQAAFAQPRGHLDPAERARLRHELREQSRAERAWQAPEWRARGWPPRRRAGARRRPARRPVHAGCRRAPTAGLRRRLAPTAEHAAAELGAASGRAWGTDASARRRGGSAAAVGAASARVCPAVRTAGPPAPDSPRLTPEERQQLRIMLRERRAAARGEGPTPPPGPER
ncbi:MAG: hypothetical protein U1E86_02325 [Burkholderiaceae bacterium]